MNTKKLFFDYNYIFLFLSFFSLFNNGILDLFGIRLYLLISFFSIIFVKNNFRLLDNILTYELIYFFILYFFIYLFIPYDDNHINERTFLQRFDGRYFSQIIRFLLEILSSLYFYYLFNRNRDLFNRVLFFAIQFTIVIALFDFIFFGKNIYSFLLGDTHVAYRYTGLNIEPRMFGLILVYVYTFLRIQKFSNQKLLLIIISIFLTISVSSFIFFLFVFLYFSKSRIFYFSILSISIFLLIYFIIIPYSETYSLVYERLFQIVTFNGVNDYFSFFSIFEVFDRASLNALMYNKIYLITGFGPNTISILSTNYIDDKYYYTYDGIINAVPHIGLINIISRSGIIFFFFIFLQMIRKKNRIFFILYLLQYNFIFYSFYLILFSNTNDEKN